MIFRNNLSTVVEIIFFYILCYTLNGVVVTTTTAHNVNRMFNQELNLINIIGINTTTSNLHIIRKCSLNFPSNNRTCLGKQNNMYKRSVQWGSVLYIFAAAQKIKNGKEV